MDGGNIDVVKRDAGVVALLLLAVVEKAEMAVVVVVVVVAPAFNKLEEHTDPDTTCALHGSESSVPMGPSTPRTDTRRRSGGGEDGGITAMGELLVAVGAAKWEERCGSSDCDGELLDRGPPLLNPASPPPTSSTSCAMMLTRTR